MAGKFLTGRDPRASETLTLRFSVSPFLCVNEKRLKLKGTSARADFEKRQASEA